MLEFFHCITSYFQAPPASPLEKIEGHTSLPLPPGAINRSYATGWDVSTGIIGGRAAAAVSRLLITELKSMRPLGTPLKGDVLRSSNTLLLMALYWFAAGVCALDGIAARSHARSACTAADFSIFHYFRGSSLFLPARADALPFPFLLPLTSQYII